jgi:hypothetical protein
MICSMETKVAVVRPLSFLALGCALIGQPRILAQTSTRSAARSQQTATMLDKKGDVTFKPGSMGEIEIDHGVPLGFTDYTASDGVWLRVLYLTVTDQSQATLAGNVAQNPSVSVMAIYRQLRFGAKAYFSIGTLLSYRHPVTAAPS